MDTGFVLERIPRSIDPDGVIQRNFDVLVATLGVQAQIPAFVIPSGSPNGVVTASPPARCYSLAGGSSTTEYLKVTGTGNTGWEKVQTAP